jgi:D-serine deaminase-like pyridoxal phosphate-dependent protein
MQAYCSAHGFALRAHVKTHKLPRIAAMQVEGGAIGIACQTLAEAEAMADAGFDRILVTYPLLGHTKWARAARLASRANLSVIGDSAAIADGLASFLPPTASVGFLIECDTGFGRAGVQTPADALALAASVALIPQLRLDGLLTHPALAAAQPWLAKARQFLVEALLEPRIVSVGGTPAARQIHELVPLATEVRVGTYVYGDRACVLRAEMSVEDCAIRVRSTVVSRPTSTRVVLDAGSKTLTSDLAAGGDDLFGSVPAYPDLRIVQLSEEHAHCELGHPSPSPHLGEVVAILPNHACSVTNLHDYVHLHRGGRLIERARVTARGH